MALRTSQDLILLPVAAQVLLTLVILVMLGLARSRSMRESRASMEDMALARDSDWNTTARKLSNSYRSQFELPVLFYAVGAFALATRMVEEKMLALAMLFVVSRIVHAAIHIGPNVVAWRFPAFLVGVACLLTMWGLLVWRIAASGF